MTFVLSERAWWRVMTALALPVAAYAGAVLVHPAIGAPFVRDRIATVPLAMYGHMAASAAALALGPFQFSTRLRARRPALHRWMGCA